MGTFSLKEEYNEKKAEYFKKYCTNTITTMALQVKGHFASQAKYSFEPFELIIISN